MNELEKAQSAKIIGVGDDGIKLLDSITEKIEQNMDLEKININQEVDKDYVRNLLDGVDILFLTYNDINKVEDIVKSVQKHFNNQVSIFNSLEIIKTLTKFIVGITTFISSIAVFSLIV